MQNNENRTIFAILAWQIFRKNLQAILKFL